jgi:hypothetical protein
LDCDQRHVSEIQERQGCNLALGYRPSEYPNFGYL